LLAGAGGTAGNEVAYKDVYGALYNWFAVDTRKLCPTGWHVSSNADWLELNLFLDKDANELASAAGNKLKATGATYWYGGNSLAQMNLDSPPFQQLVAILREFMIIS
jgi:uncharacterized protein (TIGR02145 family)